MSVTLLTAGGTGGAIMGTGTTNLGTNGVSNQKAQIGVSFTAKQIGGLVKMIPCGFADCRETDQIWCYKLPVFGNGAGQPASYYNDLNDFMVTFSGNGTPSFVIQKASDSYYAGMEEPFQWNNVATIVDGSYGTYQPLGSIAGHPTYMQLVVNWGSVQQKLGNGLYRIIFQSCITTYSAQTQASTTLPSPASVGQTNFAIVVTITITCKGTKYVFTINLPANITQAQEMAFICATINAKTNASSPFTAAISGNNYIISGTGGATQNNCLVVWEYVGGNIKTGAGWQDGGKSQMEGGTGGTPNTICTCGLQSPVFECLPWDCNRANGTTKFEVWNSGTRGDINNDGSLLDLCGISVYSSIRVTGFCRPNGFKYNPVMLKFGIDGSTPVGTVQQVHDEAIPMYKWFGILLPDWVHKQLATLMMMADTILMSDYNIANPDWTIQRKSLTKNGGYAPDYKDGKQFSLYEMDFGRRDDVTVEFEQAIQSVIASTACVSAIGND